MEPIKFIFSGHDSFECRHFWLKKGFDHALANGKFDDAAVIPLGVGRNMVTAIRYWMRAFSLLNEKDELTEFAKQLFSVKGFDPYLEDEASLWLLHYKLVTCGFSSIFNLMFNDFRRQKPEFTKEHFGAFIKNKKIEVNENTLSKDFDALLKTYISKGGEAEDNYEGILTDLDLIEEIKRENKTAFLIRTDDRERIPAEIILYCILNKYKQKSIDFESLLYDKNSVGVVFALSKNGLVGKLELIADKYKKEGVVFSDNAGIKELQFKKEIPDAKKILNDYYNQVYAS